MITPPRKAMFIHMRQSHLLLSSLTYNGIIVIRRYPRRGGSCLHKSHNLFSPDLHNLKEIQEKKKNPSRSSSPLHPSLLKSFTSSPSSHCSFFFRFYSLFFLFFSSLFFFIFFCFFLILSSSFSSFFLFSFFSKRGRSGYNSASPVSWIFF